MNRRSSTADINCSPTTIYGDMFGEGQGESDGERSDSSSVPPMPSGSSMMSQMPSMLPMPDDGEMIMEEGEIDIVRYSPPDVVIAEADVLSEDEIYAVTGIDADIEVVNDSEMYSEIETVFPEIIDESSASVETSNDDNKDNRDNMFRMFVADMINKRWTKEDIDDFTRNMKQFSYLINNEISYDVKLGMMTNPEFRNTVRDMSNKLNTISKMLVLHNRCNTDNTNNTVDPIQQRTIQQQSHIMTKLINAYKPMLMRLNLMIDRLMTDLNINQNIDANIRVDESVLDEWSMLRTEINRLLSSIKTKMNKMNKMNQINQMDQMNDTERSMEERRVEPFVENYTNCESTGNYFMTLCVIVLLGLLIYILLYRN